MNMQQMSLATWLSAIERLHPKAIDLGLERIVNVAKKLKVNSLSSFVITVAGTNGKGSTVALMEAIFHQNGYRVGSYTSPHLLNFNERIKIAGIPVTDDLLISAFEKVDAARGIENLSFFEFTTLAAFVIFQHQALDVVILEVGLGGRLDAVNIIDPDIAVITNIALDHCDWLGNTREAIANEKAGIIRDCQPVFFGEANIPRNLLKKVEAHDAKLFARGHAFDIHRKNNGFTWYNQSDEYNNLPLPRVKIDNAALVLGVIDYLQKQQWQFSRDVIRHALQTCYLPARCELVEGDNPHLFDVAHNPHAVDQLANFIRHLDSRQQIHAVFSMLKDKDIQGSIAPLKPLVSSWHIASLGNNPRAASIEQLLTAFKLQGIFPVSTYNSMIQAYEGALRYVKQKDIILVFGSFYTVAAIKGFLSM